MQSQPARLGARTGWISFLILSLLCCGAAQHGITLSLAGTGPPGAIQVKPPTLPDPPTLLDPPDGSSTCAPTPLFTWSRVLQATRYRIQVDDSPSFGSPAIDQTTADTSYQPESSLPGATYHWRVQASNAEVTGTWAAPWTVTILAPTAPNLLTPERDSSTYDRTPTFAWEGTDQASLYRIQIDDGEGFDAPLIDQTVDANTFTPTNRLSNGTYHWRVQASNTCGDSDWGEPWSFAVRNASPVANDDQVQVDEDSGDHTLDILANDTDLNGDPLRIVSVTWPAHGSIEIVNSGAYLRYRSDPDFFGQDALHYTVDDDNGGRDTARVEITVIGINDPPIADAGPDQVVYTSARVTLDGTGSYDPDGDLALRYLWIQADGPTVHLSNATLASPTFIAPPEPCALTFKLFVIDSLDVACLEPAQVVVTVIRAPVFRAYLPLFAHRHTTAPDLIVQSITVTSNNVQVVILNQGHAPVHGEFFVDAYIDPRPAPTAVNQTWDQLGSRGLVWAITQDVLWRLGPGGALTLNVNDAHYVQELSSFPGSLAVGTAVYAQVDSYNPATTYGNVLETHEITGGAYNNIRGPAYSTAAAPGTGNALQPFGR